MNPDFETSQQVMTGDVVSRIATLLGIHDRAFADGDQVPLGWHFPLLAAPRNDCRVRRDRFPGLGIALPPIEQPRLVATGRQVSFNAPLHIGQPLQRQSGIAALEEKQTAAGTITTLATSHMIAVANCPAAIEERQSFAFLSSPHRDRPAEAWPVSETARKLGEFTPDDTFLFLFSALSFNTHLIHLDRTYARDVEGYPDLVVNGGITTLLMTEYARHELGLSASRIKVVNRIPLFANRPITFMAEPTSVGSRIVALNFDGVLAAEMEIAAS